MAAEKTKSDTAKAGATNVGAPAPAYSPGLEGVIAGESAICQVNSDAGLLYRGYDVHDLAKRCSYEQVAYLLLMGELPDAAQLARFRGELDAHRKLPEQVIGTLRLQPRGAHPMDVLRTGVSMLAGFDEDLTDNSHEANLRKSIRLLARINSLAATAHRVASGKEPVPPQPGLSHAADFLQQLTGKPAEDWMIKSLNVLFILYAEHDFNASTFAARVTASTLADLYAAVTAALAALKGPLHGGANEQAMAMLEEVSKAPDAQAWVADRLAKKQLIMGFGHRIYKKGDGRAAIMHEMAKEIGPRVGQTHWVPAAEALEAAMAKQKGLFANADLYAAPLFHMMGIASELNTPIFAVGRCAGWCAHVTEQQDHNRLIRPKSLYSGVAPRPLPPAMELAK
jgi:2-methylcitrate synthase/citrate synthase II